MSEVKYPEHEKLKAVQPISQHIHDFVKDFLQDKEIVLCEYYEGEHLMEYMPTNKNLTNLIAEFLEIDQKKLEDEKDQMLEEIRAQNGAK